MRRCHVRFLAAMAEIERVERQRKEVVHAPQILRYAGPCAVCESADRREIDALIRLDKHPMEIYRKHGWVVKRDIGRHRQCIRDEGGDEYRPRHKVWALPNFR